MTETSSTLLLIDGNSITYRAFFALPPLSNAQGQFTNAVFGFTQMVLKLLQDVHPTHIAVAFDAGKKTFRHDLLTSYKGTRQKTPGELSEQFPLVREVAQAFGIPVLEVENFEADDIIGTLAARAKGTMKTILVSGDKDLLQLVSEETHAMLTKKGITDVDYYTPADVVNRYGLTPAQIVDLKGLMGDTSDNIPGVPGVGEKTAIKLLQLHPSVEEVLAHIDDAPGAKLRERLREHREQALLSKRLATITCEVPLEVQIQDLRYSGYDATALLPVFKKLGFKSLIDKISGGISTTSVKSDESIPNAQDSEPGAKSAEASDSVQSSHPWMTAPITVLKTKDQLRGLWGQLNSVLGIFADYDREDYQTANLNGMAIGSRENGFYVSFEDELSVSDLSELWDPEYEKIVFDVKALAVLLDGHGHSPQLHDGWFDVMLASYLLNPSDGEVKLEDVVDRELHTSIAPLVKDGSKESLARVALALPHLQTHLSNGLAAQELDDLYAQVELPLAFVLAKMEVLGFYVNAEALCEYGKELQGRLDQLTQQIYQLAGLQFNINSTRQLGEVLFDKLGLPAQKKTKTGYSTSADVLERLEPYHEIVSKILDYRMLGKLISTYVDGLQREVREKTGRIHTSFHQALTATGRLSSKDPNLQNIPVRMEEGRKLRQVFQPSYDDWVILSADYSQIELRVLAHLSGDDALIDAFRRDMDIHTRTAADVFEVDPSEVTSLMRRQAKAVNFGIVYGISDYGLSQNLNITRAQAAKFIEDYFAKFPGVAKYMHEIVATAKHQGFVTTLLNRRRYLPDLHSRNFNLRSFAERTAMNTPIQGSAADIIKLAMVRIDEALSNSDLKARMLLQVHDELIFECPKGDVTPLTALVQENMENAMTLNVPLKVDVHYGRTWYEAK